MVLTVGSNSPVQVENDQVGEAPQGLVHAVFIDTNCACEGELDERQPDCHTLILGFERGKGLEARRVREVYSLRVT